eukprot:10512790-Lingulodinium_polyedra.AAC.1
MCIRDRHGSVAFQKTSHSDAVESAVRCRSGSQIARLRTPCARQAIGARVECASGRLARRVWNFVAWHGMN